MFETLIANPVNGYLFIFFARVIDMSLDVFRLLLLTRGYAVRASVIGFVEVSVFVLALGMVFSGGLTDPLKILAYAAGFATGNLVGSFIEEKMALGYIVIQVFPPNHCCDNLITHLRERNFGVTRITGEGKTGPRDILLVTTKRKNQPELLKIFNDMSPEMFFNISDIRSIHGGIFPRHRP